MANVTKSSAETVIALQAVELKRLFRENKAMSDRVDTLIGEISRLRALHEKEQAQRRELQDAVVSLMHKVLAPSQGQTDLGPARREVRTGPDRPTLRSDGLALARQRVALSRPEIPAFLRRVAP